VGLVEPRPDEDGGDVDDAVGRGRRRVGSFRRVTSTCTRGDDEGHRDDESTAGGRKTRNSGRSTGMDDNEAIFEQVLDDDDFRQVLADFYLRKVYARLRTIPS
jgi:hypothetical protein